MNDSSDEDDTLKVATRNWEKLTSAASKAGYSDGVQEKSNSVFQEGFDIGYKDAFNVAFVLGKYQSISIKLPKTIEHPNDISVFLKQVNQGECYICKHNLKDKLNDLDKNEQSEDLIEKQRRASTNVINKLDEYFQKHLNYHMV